jgi:hypothetical protein
MGVNSELLKLAQWRLAENHMGKEALVPAGGDPMAGGGMPPMDPMAGGGMPPMDPMAGGMPPMDPMAGGMPPMDPMAGGPPPMDAEAIRAVIKEELAVSGNGAAGAGAGKAKKFDPAELDVKLHNMEKLLAAMANALGVSLPPETLVSPTPEHEGAGEQMTPPDPAIAQGGDVFSGAQDSAIAPIEPVEPAMPAGVKVGATIQQVGSPVSIDSTMSPRELLSKTAALAHMARSANIRGQ